MYFLLISVLSSISFGFSSASCNPRNYGFSSFVCVCNITSCDSLDPITSPPRGTAVLYESVKNKTVFAKSLLQFSSSPATGSIIADVARSTKYQFIVGFGGAFTDASGINIASLPLSMQKELISAYYSEKGLEYSMGRVPMASCDFSTRIYSYDDTPGDFNLTNFQLAMEDIKFKIPYIKMAIDVCPSQLLLFGSPWSSPGWMKTSQNMSGEGTLIGKPGGQYYQTWADYFVKFLKSYEKFNITFWGLTAENEPTAGLTAKYPFQALGFTPETQRDFIKLNLGPTLKKAGYGIDKIKLMILDDQRFLLPKWADVVLGDLDAAQYVSGIAFHWYWNSVSPVNLLEITHKSHQGVFILATEACAGSLPWEIGVELGSWERAENYAHDIIQDLLHWTIGWIDWNLALDIQGGPSWVKNFVDAPIIVNATAQEFYKQPMYYALAHFSKLLPPGSIRIGLEFKNKVEIDHEFDIAAFVTPKDQTVVITVNMKETAVPLAIHDPKLGYLNTVAPAHSIQSYAWSIN